MCAKFESSQSHESKVQSLDSSKGCSKSRAFNSQEKPIAVASFVVVILKTAVF